MADTGGTGGVGCFHVVEGYAFKCDAHSGHGFDAVLDIAAVSFGTTLEACGCADGAPADDLMSDFDFVGFRSRLAVDQ